jgi:hypothetical protein
MQGYGTPYQLTRVDQSTRTNWTSLLRNGDGSPKWGGIFM